MDSTFGRITMEHILYWFVSVVCIGNVIAQRYSYGKFYLFVNTIEKNILPVIQILTIMECKNIMVVVQLGNYPNFSHFKSVFRNGKSEDSENHSFVT